MRQYLRNQQLCLPSVSFSSVLRKRSMMVSQSVSRLLSQDMRIYVEFLMRRRLLQSFQSFDPILMSHSLRLRLELLGETPADTVRNGTEDFVLLRLAVGVACGRLFVVILAFVASLDRFLLAFVIRLFRFFLTRAGGITIVPADIFLQRLRSNQHSSKRRQYECCSQSRCRSTRSRG